MIAIDQIIDLKKPSLLNRRLIFSAESYRVHHYTSNILRTTELYYYG